MLFGIDLPEQSNFCLLLFFLQDTENSPRWHIRLNVLLVKENVFFSKAINQSILSFLAGPSVRPSYRTM